MLWMSGSSAGIFSVMICGYVAMNVVQSIGNVQQTFSQFPGVDCTLPKLVYMAINFASMAYILNHASKMGIVPTQTGDWLAYIPEKHIVENTVGIVL